MPKIKNMEATVRNSTSKSTLRRKVIDIKPDTFRGLSVIAASRGTNLKNFIESSLDELVESYDDGAVYRYLRQTDPEGLEMVSEDEKQEFEKRLGLSSRLSISYLVSSLIVYVMPSERSNKPKVLRISRIALGLSAIIRFTVSVLVVIEHSLRFMLK